MRKYNILITGGAGFIGSHLTRALCNLGHRVVAYDCLLPQVHGHAPEVDLPVGATLVRADIRDKEQLADAVADADVVYHLAALTGVGQSMYEIVDYVDVNCTGTANLLECIVTRRESVKRLILASSRAIYGEGKYRCDVCDQIVYPQGRDAAQLARQIWDLLCPTCGHPLTVLPVSEDSEPRPSSIYAVSKLSQEGLCLATGQAYNIPTVVLRFFNVYGPGQSLSNPYTGILSVFSSIIAEGGMVEVYEDGKESRDFVNVRDVVQACILSLDLSGPSGIYNVGTGTAVTVYELANRLIELFGSDTKSVITAKYRVGDIRHCVADIGRMRHALSYKPAVTFEEGLAEFVGWVQSHYAESGENLYLKAKSELALRGLYR